MLRFIDLRIDQRSPATQDLISGAHFTLDIASRALSADEGLFGLEMPLPKMDILAVGENDGGAMENWVCASGLP